MIPQSVVKEELRKVIWEEGRTEAIVSGPYRFQIVVRCSSVGRQKAVFADGEEHNYFAFVRTVNGRGEWNGEGGIIVPVLPDGRLLMVVEQRPPAHEFQDLPDRLFLDSGEVFLSNFGPYSSVEFPGGAVESDGHLNAGLLRELVEETGVKPTGWFYRKSHPHYHMASDVAARDYLAVIFLEGADYASRTEDDGGLTVLALKPEEIRRNIRRGVIWSAHAGILPFEFFEEIRRSSPAQISEMIDEGYILGKLRLVL